MSLSIKNANVVTSMFQNSNSNGIFGASSGMSDMTSLLSEYNSIKNGSFAKLAKQYYGKDVKNSPAANALNNKLEGVDGTVKNKTEIVKNKDLISDVSSLRKSVSGIVNDDTLLEKVKSKDENGNEKEDYNFDRIAGKLEEFVKNYNTVIEDGQESDNSTVLRNVLNMTKATENNAGQLKAAGITVNGDNTLSFNKDDLVKSLNGEAKTDGSKSVLSGPEAVKSLFAKNSNYMKQVDTLATNVASQAASDVFSLGGYTSTGAYKQTLENIYNTTI